MTSTSLKLTPAFRSVEPEVEPREVVKRIVPENPPAPPIISKPGELSRIPVNYREDTFGGSRTHDLKFFVSFLFCLWHSCFRLFVFVFHIPFVGPSFATGASAGVMRSQLKTDGQTPGRDENVGGDDDGNSEEAIPFIAHALPEMMNFGKRTLVMVRPCDVTPRVIWAFFFFH